jgi:putative aldouronate transport system permease protein
VFCLYPLLLTLMVSISKENLVQIHGYKFIPEKISFETYAYLWDKNGDRIVSAYTITILVTVVGTASSMLVISMFAYSIANKSVRYRNALALYAYFTVIFSAGIVPWYVVCVRVLHITETFFALFAPYLVNVWFLFLLRNYFQSIPESLIESAKIDGANDLFVYAQIIMPLSKTALLTVSMFYALQFWNDWWLPIMLVTKKRLFPLQYYLFSTLTNVQALSNSASASAASSIALPTETVKMAVTVITIGPIILLYPFIQRYFVKGLIIGAIKG